MVQSSHEFHDRVENNLENKDPGKGKMGAFPGGKQLNGVFLALPGLFVRALTVSLETGSFSYYEYLAFFFFQFWEKNICIFHPWPAETSGFSGAETPYPTKHYSQVTLSLPSETYRVKSGLNSEQV